MHTGMYNWIYVNGYRASAIMEFATGVYLLLILTLELSAVNYYGTITSWMSSSVSFSCSESEKVYFETMKCYLVGIWQKVRSLSFDLRYDFFSYLPSVFFLKYQSSFVLKISATERSYTSTKVVSGVTSHGRTLFLRPEKIRFWLSNINIELFFIDTKIAKMVSCTKTAQRERIQ